MGGSNQKQYRVVLGGLDGSGKTTIMYQLKLGELVNSLPTIGFNVEPVTIDKQKLAIWDLGGAYRIRELHRHYLPGMRGFVYVIDLSDR